MSKTEVVRWRFDRYAEFRFDGLSCSLALELRPRLELH